MRNFPNYLNKYSSLEKLEQKIRNLYKNKQYLNIISLFEVNIKILALRDMDLCFFNYTVSSLMYIAMAYFSLERYDKSLEIFNEIESRYNALVNIREMLSCSVSNNDDKRLLRRIKHILYVFNTQDKVKFYINYAYTFYKMKEKDNKQIYYDKALCYYKKALYLKCYISISQFIQCQVGIAEVQYRSSDNRFVSDEFKFKLENIIENILYLGDTFDVYLALCKLNYFKQEYEMALVYVQKALELAINDEEKRIFAYDWISRISYKTKQYSMASLFYEKIIDELINYPDQQQEEIHQRPKLHKMVKFLNETKAYLAQEESSKLSKSIWAGVFITSIFGLYEYKNHLINLDISLGYIVMLVLMLIFTIFILFLGILQSDIGFVKCINKKLENLKILQKYKFVGKLFRYLNFELKL